MINLFTFLVCFTASVIGGLCGVGGGVLAKPLLDAAGVMPIATVSFLSGLTVLSMAAISVYKNRKTDSLQWKRSLPLGIGAALGGVLGKWLFGVLRGLAGADHLVGCVQSAALGIFTLGILFYVRFRGRIQTRHVRSRTVCGLIGIFLGLISAFLGIGGGPMNIVVFHYFFSMDTKTSAVNSLLVVLISQSGSFLYSLISRTIPAFQVFTLVVMVCSGVMGGFTASRLQWKMHAKQIDRLFCAVLLLILFLCAYNVFRLL